MAKWSDRILFHIGWKKSDLISRGTLTFVDGKFPVPQRDPSGKNVERKTQKRVELRNWFTIHELIHDLMN